MTTHTQEQPTLWRVAITARNAEWDATGNAVAKDIRELLRIDVRGVSSSKLFFLQTTWPRESIHQIATALLADPVTESFTIQPAAQSPDLDDATDVLIEVRPQPGVMDPVANSTRIAIGDLGFDIEQVQVATGRAYHIAGLDSIKDAERIAQKLLANGCIENIYLTTSGRHDPRPIHLPEPPTVPFELRTVAISSMSNEQLAELSRQGHLFLSLEEMQAVQNHCRTIKREPTDLELETIAQTWSEHCVHKTLRSEVRYVGAPFPAHSTAKQERRKDGTVEVHYGNLLKNTIVHATRELIDSGRVNWCLSVFEDNAGVVAFDQDCGIAFKVETHNHPSAIEPYGGAATGSGGCIRDVMGCGLGAKPIANTDIFCVAHADFPWELLPQGILHPRRILKGIVAGVRDYGNCMGIPTVNGAIHFDDRYLGNPLVFCGCVGIIPRHCIQKQPRPGDLVVVVGGRTGRDGIHGATFSSAELTQTHADEFSHAVQIGNPIMEKRVLDAMLRARDYEGGCLYTATTDCGAGGLSSAVGEMGEQLGAEIELDRVPLKYAGLRYDEIWISEAQERMVLSVPPENWKTLHAIFDHEGVEATVIGKFRDDGRLILKYAGQVVGDIHCHFLKTGLPMLPRQATWCPQGPAPTLPKHSVSRDESHSPADELLHRLSRPNTASKEWVIRQYDHEVQGGSVIKPLVGPGGGPSDAAVLRPKLDSQRGIAIGCGLCTESDTVDPYWMAVAAVDEAIRNVVSVGGDPTRTAILDNFCWASCEDEQTLGTLVRTCQGCCDAALAHGTPFISGKDSLHNEFSMDPADAERLYTRIPIHNNRIRIPGTLLISAISMIDNVRQCVSSDAKSTSGASEFWLVALRASAWEQINLEEATVLHRSIATLIRESHVLAVHDCGSEGYLCTLAEMALGGQTGIRVQPNPPAPDVFAPILSGYILQCRPNAADELRASFASNPTIQATLVGRTQVNPRFSFFAGNSSTSPDIDLPISDLARAWRAGLSL